jgi:hypothetical protein
MKYPRLLGASDKAGVAESRGAEFSLQTAVWYRHTMR